MSGHSKWATIKHKKAITDNRRGKIFTKVIKELMIAAREGGSDLDSNARLRTVVLKARMANMPKDNIDRAIKKGAGELGNTEFFELTYEAYGPNGVAIIIETLTDNKNRTAADVRSILNKAGGSIATTGSVSRLFARRGSIIFDGEKYKEDQVLEIALEAGADDVIADEGIIEVVTAPDSFESVLGALNKAGLEQDAAEVAMVSDTMVSLDEESSEKVMNLIDRLEDNDDVQNVYHNLQASE